VANRRSTARPVAARIAALWRTFIAVTVVSMLVVGLIPSLRKRFVLDVLIPACRYLDSNCSRGGCFGPWARERLGDVIEANRWTPREILAAIELPTSKWGTWRTAFEVATLVEVLATLCKNWPAEERLALLEHPFFRARPQLDCGVALQLAARAMLDPPSGSALLKAELRGRPAVANAVACMARRHDPGRFHEVVALAVDGEDVPCRGLLWVVAASERPDKAKVLIRALQTCTSDDVATVALDMLVYCNVSLDADVVFANSFVRTSPEFFLHLVHQARWYPSGGCLALAQRQLQLQQDDVPFVRSVAALSAEEDDCVVRDLLHGIIGRCATGSCDGVSERILATSRCSATRSTPGLSSSFGPATQNISARHW